MSRLYVPTLDDPPLQAVLWRHRQDPWRPMVACMLLNMTSRRQVDEVWPELFDRWPTARDMADGDPLRQADVLDPLGLHFRVVHLRQMSRLWAARFPQGFRSSIVSMLPAWADQDITWYPGLGRYAQDSYRLFVIGDVHHQPESGDRVVQAWRELVRDCGVCLCPRCGVWAPPDHQFVHPSATAVAQ